MREDYSYLRAPSPRADTLPPLGGSARTGPWRERVLEVSRVFDLIEEF